MSNKEEMDRQRLAASEALLLKIHGMIEDYCIYFGKKQADANGFEGLAAHMEEMTAMETKAKDEGKELYECDKCWKIWSSEGMPEECPDCGCDIIDQIE